MLLLKEYIRKLLFEKRRAEKEGIKTKRGYEKLREYVGKNVFIHFSNVDKLGIYPGSKFNTPVGIYGYPLTADIIYELERAEIPFAQERLYIHVFAPQNPAKILDTANYTDGNLQVDIEKLKKMYPNISYTSMDDWGKEAKVRTPAGEIWNITRSLSFLKKKQYGSGKTSDPLSWTTILLNLGYEGVVDRGIGLIHPNEPKQGVFFGADKIKHITTISNPLVTRGRLRVDEIENLIGSVKDPTTLYSLLLMLIKKQVKNPPLQNLITQAIKEQMGVFPDEVLIKMWNNKKFAKFDQAILESIRKPNEEIAIEILNGLLDQTIFLPLAKMENILKPISRPYKEKIFNRIMAEDEYSNPEVEKRILRALLDDKTFLDKEKEDKILDALGYKIKPFKTIELK
jgi:hypothetical protein